MGPDLSWVLWCGNTGGDPGRSPVDADAVFGGEGLGAVEQPLTVVQGFHGASIPVEDVPVTFMEGLLDATEMVFFLWGEGLEPTPLAVPGPAPEDHLGSLLSGRVSSHGDHLDKAVGLAQGGPEPGVGGSPGEQFPVGVAAGIAVDEGGLRLIQSQGELEGEVSALALGTTIVAPAGKDPAGNIEILQRLDLLPLGGKPGLVRMLQNVIEREKATEQDGGGWRFSGGGRCPVPRVRYRAGRWRRQGRVVVGRPSRGSWTPWPRWTRRWTKRSAWLRRQWKWAQNWARVNRPECRQTRVIHSASAPCQPKRFNFVGNA